MDPSIAAPLLAGALLAAGCGGSGPVCRAGRTNVDGVCANERVADYVACVRAQGASLSDEKSRKLALEAGYAGAKASAVSDARDSLEKKYSASDAAVLEIVRTCASVSRAGSRRAPSRADAEPESKPARQSAHTGDRVSVNWKGSCYNARIVKASRGSYLITYEGYDHSWDETIDESRFCK